MTASVPRPSRTPAQLREVLTGRRVADPGSRRAAAIDLAHANDPGAQDVLISALSSEPDPRVRSGIVKALGWIGDADAYRPLLAAGAGFAARLVAHRHGLAASDLPALELPDTLPPPPAAMAKTIEITTPSAAAARICLDSVASRSFGLSIDQSGLRVLRCARTEWMLLVSRDLAGSPGCCSPGAPSRLRWRCSYPRRPPIRFRTWRCRRRPMPWPCAAPPVLRCSPATFASPASSASQWSPSCALAPFPSPSPHVTSTAWSRWIGPSTGRSRFPNGLRFHSTRGRQAFDR